MNTNALTKITMTHVQMMEVETLWLLAQLVIFQAAPRIDKMSASKKTVALSKRVRPSTTTFESRSI